MKKKYLWMLFAILAIVCSVSVITYNNSKEDAPSVQNSSSRTVWFFARRCSPTASSPLTVS